MFRTLLGCASRFPMTEENLRTRLLATLKKVYPPSTTSDSTQPFTKTESSFFKKKAKGPTHQHHPIHTEDIPQLLRTANSITPCTSTLNLNHKRSPLPKPDGDYGSTKSRKENKKGSVSDCQALETSPMRNNIQPPPV